MLYGIWLFDDVEYVRCCCCCCSNFCYLLAVVAAASSGAFAKSGAGRGAARTVTRHKIKGIMPTLD